MPAPRAAVADLPASRTRHAAFDDNALLPLLYGEHDRHLARIEQRLGSGSPSRGNRLTITGRAGTDGGGGGGAARTCGGGCRSGEHVGHAPRWRPRCAWPKAWQEADPRLPLQDIPAIRTRKGAIAPRTPGPGRLHGHAGARTRWSSASGPAGTGKTYLAVAQGVALLQAGRVDRIVLSRPAVEAGERLGFLPGDLKEKVDPYLRPLYDALHDMMPAEQVTRRMAAGEIEVAPLAFMRGRTLAHCYAILDEAQNTTPAQMKMFLTRMGEGTRMVITGDPTQVDLPPGQGSGLREALAILDGVAGIAVARFDERDVVRHPLVARIVAAYGRADAAASRAAGEARAAPAGVEKDGTGK